METNHGKWVPGWRHWLSVPFCQVRWYIHLVRKAVK